MDHVAVELKVKPDSTLAYMLVEAVIKHILFMRQQIHATYEDIAMEAKSIAAEKAGTAKPRRRPLASKKLLKFYSQSQLNFELLHHLFTQQTASQPGVLFVVLLLGSSPVTPREVYMLRIHHHLEPNPIWRDTRNQAIAIRHVIREIIGSGCEAFLRPLGSTQAHVMVHMSGPREDMAGFLPKPLFRLKLRERVRAVLIEVGCGEDFDFEQGDRLIKRVVEFPKPKNRRRKRLQEEEEEDPVLDMEEREEEAIGEEERGLWYLSPHRMSGLAQFRPEL